MPLAGTFWVTCIGVKCYLAFHSYRAIPPHVRFTLQDFSIEGKEKET